MGLPNNEFLKDYLFPIFIETGTEHGNGIKQVLLFDTIKEIHSIELNGDCYKAALKNFANEPRVHLYHGDCKEILGIVLETIDEPVTIWLDAHDNSHVETAPLITELEIIRENRRMPSPVIIIDDINHLQSWGWGKNISLDDVTNMLKTINPNYDIKVQVHPYEFSPHKTSYTLVAS